MPLSDYDKQHARNTMLYMRETARIFDNFANEVARLYGVLPTDVAFDINAYPDLINQLELRLRQLAKEVQTNIVNGINNEWTLANNKNDEVLDDYLKGRRLPKRLDKKWRGHNVPALEAFRRRTVEGMEISDRVWNLVKGQSVNIERHLAIGIHDGTPAAEMARELKQYLRNPEALYRRVRDSQGDLILSRAARDFHPGQGVYRSAYKNALRLTRTETNLAYQRSDNERWKQQDFVLGIEVRRSATEYDCDICDAAVGRYPKDYEWTLLHPNCICVAIPILADDDEFIKSVESGLRGEDYRFGGYVEDMPESFENFKQQTGFKHYGH